MTPYEGPTAAQQQPSNQRQMSAPPQAMPPNGGVGNNPQQQQQHPQMGAPNPYGGYPGQQHHRGPGMNMQGGGNPGFMHQNPAQGHRNSMPPPMNMGHQYPNQGGYNPNFNPNQQGHPQQQQQQHPQYGHPAQQHGYPPQQHQMHGGMPGQPQQQQHQMPQQQQFQRQHSQPMANFQPNQQPQQQQQQQQQPPPQQYGQPNPNYGRQQSNLSNVSGPSNPSDQGSSTGGPLNFNTAPVNAGNPSPGPVGGGGGVVGGPGGGGPGDYGQQFLPSGLNGDWQSDNDMHHRREMIQHIVKLLKQKDKNASPEWLTKLPQMVKQLEVSLYRSAPSFEAYSDTSTLKTRLQQLAMEIAKKTQQAKDGSGGGGTDGSGGQTSSRGQSSSRRSSSGNSGGHQQGMGSNTSSAMGGNFNMPSAPSGGGRGGNNNADAAGGAEVISNQHGNPNDPEWKVRIRHKQQRLLLLHHSSKCPYEDGKCKVTPYCGEMKKLWKHMARCTDNECRVPHCFSSRSILSHYRKCKDPRCPACGPVRETVRKTQKNQRGSSGRGNGGPRNQQQGGTGIQAPSDNSGGIGGNNNYGMPDIMGMSNNNNMGGGPLMQGSSTNATGGGSNIPMGGNNMIGAPMGTNMSQQPQMANGMPMINSNNMGGGNIMGQPMNVGPMDGMVNGSMNNGPMETSSINNMFPNQQNNNMSSMVPPQQQQPQQQLQQPAGGNHTSSNGASKTNNNSSQPKMMPPPSSSKEPAVNDDARMKPEPDAKARHKRQRLLLLRHASKCTAENGQCTVTPHCAEMKVLWKHIANCKDSYCKVRHCMSSRYVLSHYRRCKPPCNICDPVKEIIKNGFNNLIEVDPAIMEGSSGAAGVVRTTPPLDVSMQQPQTKRQKVEHNTSAPTSAVVVPPPLSALASAKNLGPSPHIAPPQSMPSSSSEKVKSVRPSQALTAPSSGAGNQPKSRQPSPKPAGSNPSDDHALLECFTTEQVKTHIQSLKKFAKLVPAELKIKCLEILKGLQAHEHGWVFATPVNPVELGLDDYFDIIKKPMDLGTIQKKLDGGSYHSFDDFRSDVRLTFENAMKYNEERTVVHEMAKELKKKFEADFKKLMKQLEKEHAENSKKVQACGLCGCDNLFFEPTVFFCSGLNCPTKRIRRNTHFYITADKQYAWCNQCFGELKGDTIDCGATKVKKADFTKRKNDETHEESWVQCDDCERWIHQICGLYNTRLDKENTCAYSCPLCLLDKRKKAEAAPAVIPEAPSAKDIPRTKLSDWLEKDVHKKVDVRVKQLAEEKAESESHSTRNITNFPKNIAFEQAYKALSAGGPLTIRQVTSTDRKHEVRDLMKARYAHKNYPEEFPYRCKCIVVFQSIDGVDVVLFALYIYEHGDDNPLPNKKTVYVSYLDSVHFMKPRRMRTFIYHEILISYLNYAREKGYEQAFIWACPPLKGDDYIFYAKPEDQKTPKDVRLRQWYLDMLEECQRRRIVGKVTNMYDQYFNDKSLDAAVVPYFEGDYFPGEAENIIKDLNDEGAKKGAGGGKKKSSSKSKKSGDVINGGNSGNEKSYKEGGRDPVMQKFCDAISGMKESFIVAFLNCKDAKPENLIVPKKIMEYRESNKALEIVKAEEEERAASAAVVKQVDRFGRPIRVLDDDKEEIDCEFFNTRQCFLDLCRGNHYQFDELRRAKHTSMMVLWHLQNREAPKFVQQCFACNREISSGVRHHCNVCPDFDLCHECFRDPNANRGQCNHTLETVKVDTASSGSTGLTEEQRKERQRNIQLHIALIEHASRCQSSKCTSSNCQKMKSYLNHGQVCKIKASGGCKICKRIWTLLRIHAQQCKSSSCPIPQCIAIRKRIRQLQMKQRAMDDRRRQEMNRHYRERQMSSS
ncbi:hypothetical protein ACHAXR_012415 [Thalassiosira sp. AJA248-18]